MIILKSVEQLRDLIKDTYASCYGEREASLIAEFIVYNRGDNDEIRGFLTREQKEYNPSLFGEVSQAIFQLNDYRLVLKNYIEMLLVAKQYDSICDFVNKLFVANVGTYKYRSVQKAYSLSERYFDRFVEIIKYCELDDELLMPYFIAILKADASSLCYNYKEPLKEYLKLYMQSAHEKLFAYVAREKLYDCFEYFLDADTNKTLRYLIEGYVDGVLDCVGLIRAIIVKYKQEAFNLLEGFCYSDNEEVAFRATGLILMFKGDWGVDNFLNSLYQKSSSQKVQKLISRELEIEKFVNFGSKDEYVAKVLEETETVQERLYGLRMRKYYEEYDLQDEFEGKSATYIMETFKTLSNETLIRYMPEYFAFAEEETKTKIAQIVYDLAEKRGKLNGSKWALRLIATFGSEKLIFRFNEVVIDWLINLKNSDAEYFYKCLAMAKRDILIELIKRLRVSKLVDSKKLKKLEKTLALYSETSGIPEEKIEYMLAEDFGLNEEGYRIFDLGRRKVKIQLMQDLNVKIYNSETGKEGRLAQDVVGDGLNLKEYVKAIEKEVSKQKKRFWSLFLNATQMSLEDFRELIIGHNILKIVASNMLWGKYKNDRLYETFKLVDGKITHISGNYVVDEEYKVALVHPLDLKETLETVKGLAGTLAFEQLDFPTFNVASYGNNAVSVENFNGMFVNANLFITRLEKLTYKINGLGKDFYYNTLVKANPRLNLLTAVEFDRVKLNEENNYTTTISSVRFYKLNSIPKDGKNYMLSRGENIPLASLGFRVFSNEIALVFRAAENKTN